MKKINLVMLALPVMLLAGCSETYTQIDSANIPAEKNAVVEKLAEDKDLTSVRVREISNMSVNVGSGDNAINSEASVTSTIEIGVSSDSIFMNAQMSTNVGSLQYTIGFEDGTAYMAGDADVTVEGTTVEASVKFVSPMSVENDVDLINEYADNMGIGAFKASVAEILESDSFSEFSKSASGNYKIVGEMSGGGYIGEYEIPASAKTQAEILIDADGLITSANTSLEFSVTGVSIAASSETSIDYNVNVRPLINVADRDVTENEEDLTAFYTAMALLVS